MPSDRPACSLCPISRMLRASSGTRSVIRGAVRTRGTEVQVASAASLSRKDGSLAASAWTVVMVSRSKSSRVMTIGDLAQKVPAFAESPAASAAWIPVPRS